MWTLADWPYPEEGKTWRLKFIDEPDWGHPHTYPKITHFTWERKTSLKPKDDIPVKKRSPAERDAAVDKTLEETDRMMVHQRSDGYVMFYAHKTEEERDKLLARGWRFVHKNRGN